MVFQTNFNEDEKLWSGVEQDIYLNPKASIGHAIMWSLRRNSAKILQINHETNIQLTGEFLHLQTIRATQNLRNLGYEPNDIFGVIAKNGHYLTPIVFAAICMGCPIVTLDTAFNRTEILHMFRTTPPKVMFCDANVAELAQSCLQELEIDAKIFSFSGQTDFTTPVEDLFEPIIGGDDEFAIVDVDGINTAAFIVCTSGSTGFSKGVALSHATMSYQVTQTLLGHDDICLTFSSMYWISGILLLLASTINGTCRLITTEPFSIELMLDMIEEHRVTVLFGSSHVLVLALKCEKFYQTDLSSLRLIICGGSKISAETAKHIFKHLNNCRVMNGYGMTEMGGLLATADVNESYNGTLGKLIIGVKVKICDENGQRLNQNEIGEICVQNEYEFMNYYGNQEATENSHDEEGFLKTGDIGYFNDANELFLVDRKKDMIKYCSSQVSPTEIEGLLIELPGIRSVCVVGIPDTEVGDLPAAVIVRSGYEPETTIEEIENVIIDNLADYKQLRGGVYFVNSLPLTPSGKIVRRMVKEIAIELYEQNQKQE